jgi:hypothetical protein
MNINKIIVFALSALIAAPFATTSHAQLSDRTIKSLLCGAGTAAFFGGLFLAIKEIIKTKDSTATPTETTKIATAIKPAYKRVVAFISSIALMGLGSAALYYCLPTEIKIQVNKYITKNYTTFRNQYTGHTFGSGSTLENVDIWPNAIKEKSVPVPVDTAWVDTMMAIMP